MEITKLTDYASAKTSLEQQLQQTLTHLDSVSSGLYQGAHTSTITTDSVVSCVSSTLPTASSALGKQICNDNHLDLQPCTPERKKCLDQEVLLDAINGLPVHEQKSPCCGITTTPTPPASIVAANDIARESWYAAAAHHHHHHHHHTGAHQQLAEVMYSPAPAATAATIGKFGLDTSTEGYLNARYNVNVKGVRHERTSSFFDSIPAVTHPYYRFPATPPAGILKKSDEESAYCNNASPGVTASLHLGHPHHHPHQHFAHHNTKVEHADSTTATTATSTTQLSHHHHVHAHHAHHHHHQQSHQHANNLQSHHHHHTHHPHAQPSLTHAAAAHLPGVHASAFKFSHAGVYSAAGIYQQSGGAAEQLSVAATSNSTEAELKYESPYNSTISSTYPGLRSTVPVDSTTAVAAVTSSDGSEMRIDQFYASNAISTSQTVTSQRRGSLQLWQFLVALLDEPTTSSSCIAWTGRGMEFKLIEPEEVARRWGIQKNRPAMNYDKLSRSLRYYYEKGIMQKVNGERYVYRFVCDPDALFNMAYGHLSSAHTKSEHNHILSSAASISLTKSNSSAEVLNRANSGGSSVTSTLEPQSVINKSPTDFYGSVLHKFP